MRFAKLLAILALWATPLAAQNGPPSFVTVPAPAEPAALPLYGDQTPGSGQTEIWSNSAPIGYAVRNVTRPTLTPYLPAAGKGTGAAVIVAPGGAFMGLALEHEGWRVARELADRGIAAFVLKYRVVQTPVDAVEAGQFMGRMMANELGNPMQGALLRQSLAPTDARAALALVRRDAARWGVDPARLGIIGFSAGAMTARRVAIDGVPSGRPAFVGYIYGPQDAEPIPADAPPLFNAIAFDDAMFIGKGFAIAAAWHEAKRPVEVHGYQSGGHGFGLGKPDTTTTLLMDQFVAWLAMQGFLKPDAK